MDRCGHGTARVADGPPHQQLELSASSQACLLLRAQRLLGGALSGSSAVMAWQSCAPGTLSGWPAVMASQPRACRTLVGWAAPQPCHSCASSPCSCGRLTRTMHSATLVHAQTAGKQRWGKGGPMEATACGVGPLCAISWLQPGAQGY